MWKKCEQCQSRFYARGNTRYCSNTCRKQAQKQQKKKTNEKYYETHRKTTRTIRCRWCGKQFTTSHNNRYCNDECRKQSRREISLRSTRKHTRKWGLSEKARYFANLGNSNLRQYRNKILSVEYKKILAEKKRLGL